MFRMMTTTLCAKFSTSVALQLTANSLCDTLQNCNTLQHTPTHSNPLQHTPTHSNTPQHTPTRCNTRKTLQHAATRCNTLQHAVCHNDEGFYLVSALQIDNTPKQNVCTCMYTRKLGGHFDLLQTSRANPVKCHSTHNKRAFILVQRFR